MTRHVTIRQADLDRALAVAVKRGLPVSGYEIKPDGTIVVLTGAAPQTNAQLSDLERWELEHGHRAP